MPDLLASTQITALPHGLAPALPQCASPIALPGAADIALDFGAALSGLLIAGGAPKPIGERQAAAGGGKELPGTASDPADELDPTIIWLPDAMVALPTPISMRAAAPAATLAPAQGGSDVAAIVPPPQPAPGEVARTLVPTAAPTGSPVPAEAGNAAILIESAPATQPDAPVPTLTIEVEDVAAARDRFDLPARDGARPQAAPLLAPQSQAVVQPAITHGVAAQVFATALNGTAAEPIQLDRAGDAVIQLAGQTQVEQRTTVQAMSATSQAPLDLSQGDWPAQMIDRIAALRDSAEAADTRIKLAPENLGALEVSIRRDGDRVHVHFTADNPAARQLIADAAPRLAELADARGVKLGQTSVDAGTQQSPQQGDRQPQGESRQQGAGRNILAGQPADPTTDERIA